MSFKTHRIGWIGAVAVAVLSPFIGSAASGLLDGFFDGAGLPRGWPLDVVAFALGIALTVWVVMAVSAGLARRRGVASGVL